MSDKTREDFEAWKACDNPRYHRTDDSMGDRRDWLLWQAATQQSVARIAALEAEVLALRKDAERYKWLRSVPNGFKAQRIVNDTPHGMDAAIDAAIEAERGEG